MRISEIQDIDRGSCRNRPADQVLIQQIPDHGQDGKSLVSGHGDGHCQRCGCPESVLGQIRPDQLSRLLCGDRTGSVRSVIKDLQQIGICALLRDRAAPHSRGLGQIIPAVSDPSVIQHKISVCGVLPVPVEMNLGIVQDGDRISQSRTQEGGTNGKCLLQDDQGACSLRIIRSQIHGDRPCLFIHFKRHRLIPDQQIVILFCRHDSVNFQNCSASIQLADNDILSDHAGPGGDDLPCIFIDQDLPFDFIFLCFRLCFCLCLFLCCSFRVRLGGKCFRVRLLLHRKYLCVRLCLRCRWCICYRFRLCLCFRRRFRLRLFLCFFRHFGLRLRLFLCFCRHFGLRLCLFLCCRQHFGLRFLLFLQHFPGFRLYFCAGFCFLLLFGHLLGCHILHW